MDDFSTTDVSPTPLCSIVLGFWLPLDWILSSRLLQGLSLLEIGYAISASVWFNFGLFMCVVLAGVYFVASCMHLLGYSFRTSANFGIRLVTWMVFFFVVSLLLKKLIYLKVTPYPVGLVSVLNGIVVDSALLLTLMRTAPQKLLEFPRKIALTLIPISLVLVACEGMGFGHSAHIQGPGAVPKRPDILFITVDALAARHLTMYGYQRPTSPNLQSLADESITLDHCYANSNWTRPGVADLLNGVRPWTHDGDLGLPRGEIVRSDSVVRQLAQAGYVTQCVSTNGLVAPESQNLLGAFHTKRFIDANLPFLNGLNSRFPSLVQGFALGPAVRLSELALNHSGKAALEKTQDPLEATKELLAIPHDRPRFTWVHLMTTHSPYATPRPYMGSFEASPLARTVGTSHPPYGFAASTDPCFPTIYEGRYDEAIRCLDDGLGALFAWLKARNSYNNMLIVFTADHGESFTHGYGQHGGPLLSEDLLWIPCLIKPPFHKGAEHQSGLVEQVDLAPTLLQMVNVAVPAGMEGRPMTQRPERLPAFSMNRDFSSGPPTFSVAVIQGGWKYVEHFGHWSLPWPKQELYNTARDPMEVTDQMLLQPARAANMRALILTELARRNLKPWPN